MSKAKRYYWLKLQEDFFESKRIKKLRRIAGGDTYTIIYLKMQLLAMKNGGVLVHSGLEDTFADELALDLNEDADNVGVTVNYLLSCGLLETSDDKEFFVPYSVLNTGSEGSSAKRMREHRERQALQSNNNVPHIASHCDGEIEKEIDIEIEKEIDIEDSGDKRPAPAPSIPYETVKNLYNSICVSFPRCTKMSDARKKAVKARFNGGYKLDDFQTLFTKAEASAFLKGGSDRNWQASFDWLIKDANMAKVLDGNYDDRAHQVHNHYSNQRGGNGFETSNPFLEMLNERRGAQ